MLYIEDVLSYLSTQNLEVTNSELQKLLAFFSPSNISDIEVINVSLDSIKMEKLFQFISAYGEDSTYIFAAISAIAANDTNRIETSIKGIVKTTVKVLMSTKLLSLLEIEASIKKLETTISTTSIKNFCTNITEKEIKNFLLCSMQQILTLKFPESNEKAEINKQEKLVVLKLIHTIYVTVFGKQKDDLTKESFLLNIVNVVLVLSKNNKTITEALKNTCPNDIYMKYHSVFDFYCLSCFEDDSFEKLCNLAETSQISELLFLCICVNFFKYDTIVPELQSLDDKRFTLMLQQILKF